MVASVARPEPDESHNVQHRAAEARQQLDRVPDRLAVDDESR